MTLAYQGNPLLPCLLAVLVHKCRLQPPTSNQLRLSVVWLGTLLLFLEAVLVILWEFQLLMKEPHMDFLPQVIFLALPEGLLMVCRQVWMFQVSIQMLRRYIILTWSRVERHRRSRRRHLVTCHLKVLQIFTAEE
jgi:hypothetical protein